MIFALLTEINRIHINVVYLQILAEGRKIVDWQIRIKNVVISNRIPSK